VTMSVIVDGFNVIVVNVILVWEWGEGGC